MALQCNIDGRGKVVRLICGMMVGVMGGLILGFHAYGSGSVVLWGLGCAGVVAGGFMIFEAWAGWCVVRAMGKKTPL
ncbi:MAG TPA: hypothetical protein VFE58_00675 [Tepidisphaeraceae bacterium]|jgi:hypothetical protein|nr:hypothetical protein [Tepidisphaeraceae bacterium]